MGKRPAKRAGSAGGDPEALATTQPISDIEKLRRHYAELGEILRQFDGQRGPFERLSYHVRRHLPLYALGAVFALIVVLVPTTRERGPASTAAGGETFGGFETEAAGEAASEVGAQVASRAGRLAGRAAGGAVQAVGEPVGQVEIGAGITRGGFECKPGVRQLPFSTYAYPCVGTFEGNNGGKTYRGVDDKTIKLVVRKTADSGGPSAQTVDEANKAAGRATRTEALEFAKKYWIPYFNKTFELYGRQVEIVEYGSTVSNGVDEAQSKGKDGACADATAIANNVQGFAVIGFNSAFTESHPFSQCAVEKGGLLVPLGASYFPEGAIQDPKGIKLDGVSYRNWHPYVWHIVMECEQIAQDVAEYMGKRLLDRNAKWARSAAYQQQKRVFGTYVPDNAGYQHCVNVFEDDFKNKYGGKIKHRFNYQLDVARFPDQAAQAAVQFQSAGVTTLIQACDTISTRLLTEAADKQQWGPEWYIIGVAAQDSNGSARTFNQAAVDGHLFGMSQLGPDQKVLGKEAEPYIAFKAAFPNVTPPAGALQLYFPLLHIFNLFQAAGPILRPQNIAVGVSKMPPGGGGKGAVGTWSLADDHTEIDDSREIYWDRSVQAIDGQGSYIETYGGERFGSGDWPQEEPPVYPKK